MRNIYQLNLKKGFLLFTVGLLAVFQTQGRTFAENFDAAAGVSINATETLRGAIDDVVAVKAEHRVQLASVADVTFGDGSFVYDGTAHSLAITGTLPAGMTVDYDNNGRTNVGTQVVTATLSGPGYPTEVLSAELTVSPAPIIGISFEDEIFVYDGTARSLAIDGTLPSGTAVVYSNNSRTDVGTQEVTATISGSNYTTLVLTANLTISPVAVPIFAFNSESFVYDGEAHSLAISGTLPIGTIVTYNNNSRTDVGTQKVSATISGENYIPLVLNANLTITEAEITGITLEDASFVYDGTVHSLEITGELPAGTTVVYSNNGLTDVGTQRVTATITGSNYAPLILTADLTVSPAPISGITLEDNTFVYDGSTRSLAITGTLPSGTAVEYSNNSITDVGTQEVTATISGSNYITLVLTADLTITPATISGITFEGESFVYDGTVKSLAIGGTLPTGTTVAYTNNGLTDVGTQEVTATIAGSNYTTLVLTAELAVTPATLTNLTFVDKSFEYDGSVKSLAVTGVLSTGTSVVYTNNGRTDIGAQEVTATISRANYTTLVLTANLTVTPATIKGITFKDKSIVYDGTSHSLAINGSLPAGTTIAYSNNSRTNVGTQEATATISGPNFTTLVLTADLNVTPATITGLTFKYGTFVYDGKPKSLAVSGPIHPEMTVSFSNNSRTNVGVQEATATIARPNYTTLVLTAELIITPAKITGVAFGDNSFEYDGKAHSLAIHGTLPSGTTVAYSNNSRKDAGTQQVTATISGSNYTTLALTADLTVTPQVLSIIPVGGAFKYEGNSDPTLAYQVQGWADGDGIELVSGNLSREPGEAVGEYQITLGSLEAGSNYQLELQQEVFAINAKYIVAVQNPEMITAAWNTPFDQTEKPATVVVELVDGSTASVGVNWQSSEYNQLEAGIYSIRGVLTLDGIENPQELETELLILVEDKLPPTDINLSNGVFAADIDRNTAIGTLSTVDAQDNVHSYQLVNTDQNDGHYFRVEGNVLYWNSDEGLAGKTSFTIKVRSTDRKGNSIEREFTLTRSRISIGEIDVFTVFTPNGDGVNDTWGVSDLKYVEGARVEVFDRSGRRLFHTDKPEVRWDGTFEGREMPAGAYLWALKFQQTGEIRRGTLTLLKQ